MSAIEDVKASYGLAIKSKPQSEEERVAKIRERERRERKEKLYSYRLKKH